jgi:putative membrane protein insertion efficiency factor
MEKNPIAPILSRLLIKIIRGYRFLLSPLLGQACRFYPSCSAYAEEAIRQYGVFYGAWLTIKRLLRCHPWSSGGFDPVLLYPRPACRASLATSAARPQEEEAKKFLNKEI